MMFVPTRGRPQWLSNYIKAYRETKAVEPVVLLMDFDEPQDYSKPFSEMEDLSFSVSKAGRQSVGSRLRAAWELFPDEDVYFYGCDDSEPQTEHWDRILRERALATGICWSDDLYEHRCTLPVVSGKMAKSVGFLFPPTLNHLYGDTFWSELAGELKIDGYMPEVKIKHHKDIEDQTHRERNDRGDDENWRNYRATGFIDLVRRVACYPSQSNRGLYESKWGN